MARKPTWSRNFEVEIIVGSFKESVPKRLEAEKRLDQFITDHQFEAFSEVLVTQDFDQGALALVQCHALGPLKPNLLMLGWPSSSEERSIPTFNLIKVARQLKVSSVILIDRGLPSVDTSEMKRIDIWWREVEKMVH